MKKTPKKKATTKAPKLDPIQEAWATIQEAWAKKIKPKKPGYGTLTSGHILVRAPRDLVTLAAERAAKLRMPQQAWWRNAARAALGISEGLE